MLDKFSRWPSVAFLAVLVLGGCTSCNDTTRKPPSGTQQSCAPTSQQSPAVTSSGAVIVTDTSGSMMGFVAPGSTRLYTVHDTLERALRNALGAVGSDAAIRRCDLGGDLKCDSAHTKADMDKPIYTAPQSRLDYFFTADAKGRSTGTGGDDGGLIEANRIAVLATDGMQAQPIGTPAPGGGKPCLGGADPECMAYLLKQRVAAGYGVWMALLYLPFTGAHAGYRPLDNSHWQRIQQHVAGLAQDPYFQGVSFKLGARNAKPTFTAYGYQGVKPFLIIAVSKDHRAGREFIKQLTDIARKESVTQPANGIYSIELAPIPSRTLQIASIKKDPNSRNEAISLVTRERKNGYYDFLAECDREGEAAFFVEAKQTDETQALIDSAAVEFTLVASGDDKLPADTLTVKGPFVKGADPGTLRAEVGCKCKTVKTGAHARWFKLQANLKSDLDASSPWTALHTDNTYEAPERFYGLKDLVRKILEPAAKEPRVSDCLQFRLQRK